MEFARDPSFRGQTKTNATASAPCHVGVAHQQSSISRVATKPVKANPRFSGRGMAVRERGGANCPDHRGGAGSDINNTYSGRGQVTHDPVLIRPVAIPKLIYLSQMGPMPLFTYLSLLLGPTFYIHWAEPYTLVSMLGCGSDHIHLGRN